jgi:hypothetical protein
MTFWVLDPWFCVPGFHQVCHSSKVVSRVERFLFVTAGVLQHQGCLVLQNPLEGSSVVLASSGFRPFGFAPPVFTGFAFQRQPGYRGHWFDFRSLGFASPFFNGFALV